MDESKLLDECISLNLTPLETILLNFTVSEAGRLLEFLIYNNCIQAEKLELDGSKAPSSEQTSNVLLESALKTMEDLAIKIYTNGSKIIGEEVPDEFKDITSLYNIVLEQISSTFVGALIIRGDQ